MTTSKLNKSLLLVAAFFVAACTSIEIPNLDLQCVDKDYQTENVVVVIIDGPRMSETWEHEEQFYIPYLAKEIAPKAIIGREFYNLGNTFTIPGHIAITTGSYEFKTNDGSEFPYFPSMFQYYLSCTNNPPQMASLITAKKKLEVLSNCEDIGFRDAYRPALNTEDRTDVEVFLEAKRTLEVEEPHLSLVHFKGPDAEGHHGDWDGYLRAIQETDSLLNKVIKLIETLPNYKGKTTVIMTNDHGRHLDGIADGFKSHGDHCRGCTHINFMALGPDFKTNVLSDTKAELIDILPTIGELLGFEVSGLPGRVMWELFK